MNEETTIDLQGFFYTLKKRIKLIIGITLGFTIAAGILSFFVIKPTYEAETVMIVGKPQANAKDNTQYNDVMMYQNLVKTYAEIAKSDSVAEETSEKLKENISAEKLEKMITVTPQQGTQLLKIKASSNNAEEAVSVVNAVSKTFIDESKRVFPTGGDIQVMDKAKFPDKPVAPKKALNIVIAFFIGLIAALGLAFVLEYMDSTVKTEEDITKYLDLPVIGMIPKNKKAVNS